MPAHSLAEGIRRAARWGLRAKDELLQDVSEYAFEEARLLGRQQRDVLRDHLIGLRSPPTVWKRDLTVPYTTQPAEPPTPKEQRG